MRIEEITKFERDFDPIRQDYGEYLEERDYIEFRSLLNQTYDLCLRKFKDFPVEEFDGIYETYLKQAKEAAE